jgi:hypothetical protein
MGGGNHLKTSGSEGRDTLPAVVVPAQHFEDSGDYLRQIPVSYPIGECFKAEVCDRLRPPILEACFGGVAERLERRLRG